MSNLTNASLSALAATLLGITATFAPTQAAHADGTSFAIYNLDTQNCLDVKTWSTSPGAIIQQYHCAATTNQWWYADVIDYDRPGGGAIVHLRSVGSGLCLDLATVSPAPGIGLIQNTCNGSASQEWIIDPPWQSSSIGGGSSVASVRTWRHIKNAYSGLCIDNVSPGGDRAKVQQWDCANVNNQLWRVPLF